MGIRGCTNSDPSNHFSLNRFRAAGGIVINSIGNLGGLAARSMAGSRCDWRDNLTYRVGNLFDHGRRGHILLGHDSRIGARGGRGSFEAALYWRRQPRSQIRDLAG
jgi:hypothetical protein